MNIYFTGFLWAAIKITKDQKKQGVGLVAGSGTGCSREYTITAEEIEQRVMKRVEREANDPNEPESANDKDRTIAHTLLDM
ncbi:MAG TPA: hypothetical protein VGF67_09770 [Ktedonobacteraceae bacterium]